MTKAIYIVLTNTGTLLSKMIGFYTGAPYNHTSIGLDKALKEIYSFGRKNPDYVLPAGFVQENLEKCLYKNTSCCVYKIEMDDAEYALLKVKIQKFEKHEDKYRYNLIGLFGVMFHIPVSRKYHYFCSQFVAEILQDSGTYSFEKSPSLITPDDFHSIEKAKLVYQGSLWDYISYVS